MKKLCVTFLLLNFLNICAISIVVPKNPPIIAGVPLDTKNRPGSYPYLCGDTFRAFCDHVIDETRVPFDPAKVQHGDTIFLNYNYRDFFFNEVHPLIKARYILVTHNTIHPAPGIYKDHLNDDRIAGWFAKNVNYRHPKMHYLPLGIANPHWPHGKIKLFEQALQNVPIEKNKDLYINFALWTNKERPELYNYFANKPFCYVTKPKELPFYLKELAESKFVLSPEGNSIDCHRTWETLLMGSYPILKTSSIDPLFEDLPVWIIEDWSQVTQEALQAKYNEFSSKKHTFNYEKLYADYWLKQIASLKAYVQKAARQKSLLQTLTNKVSNISHTITSYIASVLSCNC